MHWELKRKTQFYKQKPEQEVNQAVFIQCPQNSQCYGTIPEYGLVKEIADQVQAYSSLVLGFTPGKELNYAWHNSSSFTDEYQYFL